MGEYNRYYRAYRRQYNLDQLENDVRNDARAAAAGNIQTWPQTPQSQYYARHPDSRRWAEGPSCDQYAYPEAVRGQYAVPAGLQYNSCWATSHPPPYTYNGTGAGARIDGGYSRWTTPRTRTFSGRCRYNLGNGHHCPENIRNSASRYCELHTLPMTQNPTSTFTYDGYTTYPANYSRALENSNPRDRYAYHAPPTAHQDERAAAYQTVMAELANVRRKKLQWDQYHRRCMRQTSGNDRPEYPGTYAYHPEYINTRSFPPMAAGICANASGLTFAAQDAWEPCIYDHEIDADNWPRFLKCGICNSIYTDPVIYTDPTTQQQTVCCRSCTDSSPLKSLSSFPWRARLFPHRMVGRDAGAQLQPATRIEMLRSSFEDNFINLVTTMAPRQICHFCERIMTQPTVTCEDVEPQYLAYRQLQGARPVGMANHAFCAACLHDFRFKDGADLARCPFGDCIWNSTDQFPVNDDYVREAHEIASFAWEKALETVDRELKGC
ncbi:hypothetical protein DRE_00412 [Drechslerella stenobrocha 248]|uniref:Uncharacterized protein n=1 Tax=Drechslerella stenobrocha 248 TaxID=1043628 RepID=W7HV83_9PEZI|nr:hypothetical protein DRE_00412 [Drechslerella stenobrocha 248]